MRASELLWSGAFEVVLEEVLHLVEPLDGGRLSAHVAARDGVLTVTAPFMYGIGVRVGAHFVGSTYGEATVELRELVHAVQGGHPLPSRSTSSDEILVPPLAGWNRVARLGRPTLDRHLRGIDRRMMETLDQCALAGVSASSQGHDTETDPAAEEHAVSMTLARPVDMWDMGDGTSVCLPGSFLFAAAVLGHLGDEAVVYEQGRWLCLSTGGVEYLSASAGVDWRIAIAG